LYAFLRFILRHVRSFYAALGIYIIAGLVIAVVATWGFAEVAEAVKDGATHSFDVTTLKWLESHRVGILDRWLIEITALGTGLVVFFVAGIAALFLVLTSHRYSALLLGVATVGELLLNTVLKTFYHRPRPSAVEPLATAFSSSFPSGHAMSAIVVYGTIAYLIARLVHHRWERMLTCGLAALVILLISLSRVYLGVHYPSDVLAGAVVGLGWATFCMAGLAAVRVFAEGLSPSEFKHERELAPAERAAEGLQP
jgi:undecaprenyl-diphosphatase